MPNPHALLFLFLAAVPSIAAASTRTAIAVQVPATARQVPDASGVSEEFWLSVPPNDTFVQREPMEGAAPSQRTEFRVAYDATTLYVRVRAFDSEPDRIAGYLSRRDADSPADWLRVLIDSYHDRRTAYEFAVNPSGVKQDGYWYNDNNRDNSWDAVWDVAVARDPLGWSAEFRIPFSQLRFNPGGSNTFGLAVSRQIARVNETSTWPLLARSATGYVSSFGDLAGLSMAHSPKRLEATPYSVASYTRQPTGGNPLVRGAQPGAAVGADLKYALTPGLTISATFNPDFGQVEADPAVVNLSAFETFFSERRPFFVEGSGNFSFDTDCNDGNCSGLFYSRRLGRGPQGVGDLPHGNNVYTDPPRQTSILGAGKLTGRVGHFSVGVLSAVTQEESAAVLTAGVRSAQAVEPLTHYTVGRLRREFAGQSSFGFILTSASRRIRPELGFLPNAAYTGGLDADWRFKRMYSLKGYLAGSSIQGSAESIARIQRNSRHYFQRPGSPVAFDGSKTVIRGGAGQLNVEKIGGQRLRGNLVVAFNSPGYDTNDVGFVRRADTRSINAWLQVRNDTPTGRVRSRRFNVNHWQAWNSAGDLLDRGGNVNAHWTFNNNWRAGGGLNVDADAIDDRVTRGGPAAFVERGVNAWYYIATDDRRMVSLSYDGGTAASGHGSRSYEIAPGVTLRPMPALHVDVRLRYRRNIEDSQWVDTMPDGPNPSVFGHLDQQTVELTSRVNYTITPNLSVQLYAAPFVSGGNYQGFKQLQDPREPDYDRRYAPSAYDGNPDFNYRSFRTTNVVRWEYRPGSTLFVVWQQAREQTATSGGFNVEDLGKAFRAPGTNMFLVKLAYWFNG